MASNPWETTEAQKEDKEVVAFDQASRLLEALRFRSEVCLLERDWRENGLQRSRLLVEQRDSAHDVRLGRLAHEQSLPLTAVAVIALSAVTIWPRVCARTAHAKAPK